MISSLKGHPFYLFFPFWLLEQFPYGRFLHRQRSTQRLTFKMRLAGFSSNSHHTFYWSIEAYWSKSQVEIRSRNRENGDRSQGCAALLGFYHFIELQWFRYLCVGKSDPKPPTGQQRTPRAPLPQGHRGAVLPRKQTE